jgi:hypothetical protein
MIFSESYENERQMQAISHLKRHQMITNSIYQSEFVRSNGQLPATWMK